MVSKKASVIRSVFAPIITRRFSYVKRNYCSYVSYQGAAGKYYKAYVCIWAGKTAAAHAVYMGNTWATSVKATECSYTTSHGIPIPWHSRFIHNTLNS